MTTTSPRQRRHDRPHPILLLLLVVLVVAMGVGTPSATADERGEPAIEEPSSSRDDATTATPSDESSPTSTESSPDHAADDATAAAVRADGPEQAGDAESDGSVPDPRPTDDATVGGEPDPDAPGRGASDPRGPGREEADRDGTDRSGSRVEQEPSAQSQSANRAGADAVGAAAAQQDDIYGLSVASVSPQATQVGTAFADDMQIYVFKLDGTGAAPGVDVTFTAPDSGPSGTFATTGTNVVTVASGPTGIARAPQFTANDEVGSFSVRATAPQAGSNSFAFSITVNPATSAFTISVGNGSGQAAQVLTTFAIRMAVAVFNGSGQLLPGIDVVFAAPDSGASGTFAATGTNQVIVPTGGTGLATAPVFLANGVDGEYVVTATIDGSQTADGEPLATSFALRNTLDSPVGVPYIVSSAGGGGQQTTILTPFTNRLKVAVFDGTNRDVPGASVTFSAPTSGPSGTFPNGQPSATVGVCTSSTCPAQDVGLFVAPPFTANDVAGSYSVRVTATKDGVTAETTMGLSNGRAETSTGLQVDPPGSSVTGEALTLTATTTQAVGNRVPTGVVEFTDGGTTIAACAAVALSGGVATCRLDDPAVGDHLFRAVYPGGPVSQPSQSVDIAHEVFRADPPVFSKAFSPTAILPGDVSRLTFTIDSRANVVNIDDLAFTDDLPTGMTVANTPEAVTDCTGGTLSAAAGAASITWTAGTVVAGAVCTIGVNVTATTDGDHVNTTSQLASAAGSSSPASATLEVFPPPGFSKAFTPESILVGETSRLRLSIDNSASSLEVGDLAFTDAFPDGMVVAAVPDAVSDCGGVVTADAGAGVVSLIGGVVAAGGSCTVAVDVTATAGGTYANTSGDLTSAAGSSGPASAAFEVTEPPTLSAAFAPASILPGEISRLTTTIASPVNPTEVVDLAATVTLPVGLAVAAMPNATTDCGGTLTALPGAATVSSTAGAVSAGGTCTIQVDVTTADSGQYVASVELASSAGSGGPATATLDVAAVATTFTVQAATGTGQIDGVIAGGGPACGVASANAVDVTAVATSGPVGVDLPHGLIALVLDNCQPGASVDVTLTLPSGLDAPASYWKFSAAAGWYEVPASAGADTIITFTLVDGGLGDSDLDANGTIVDPGGPGQPEPDEPTESSSTSAPRTSSSGGTGTTSSSGTTTASGGTTTNSVGAQLPATGMTTAAVAAVAVGLLLAGTILVATGRRRRTRRDLV